jgi:hypothetical protein
MSLLLLILFKIFYPFVVSLLTIGVLWSLTRLTFLWRIFLCGTWSPGARRTMVEKGVSRPWRTSGKNRSGSGDQAACGMRARKRLIGGVAMEERRGWHAGLGERKRCRVGSRRGGDWQIGPAWKREKIPTSRLGPNLKFENCFQNCSELDLLQK